VYFKFVGNYFNTEIFFTFEREIRTVFLKPKFNILYLYSELSTVCTYSFYTTALISISTLCFMLLIPILPLKFNIILRSCRYSFRRLISWNSLFHFVSHSNTYPDRGCQKGLEVWREVGIHWINNRWQPKSSGTFASGMGVDSTTLYRKII
jgi:hypothetical protein